MASNQLEPTMQGARFVRTVVGALRRAVGLWRMDAGTERAKPARVRRALGLALAAATPPGAPLLTRTRALVMQNIVGRFARTQS